MRHLKLITESCLSCCLHLNGENHSTIMVAQSNWQPSTHNLVGEVLYTPVPPMRKQRLNVVYRFLFFLLVTGLSDIAHRYTCTFWHISVPPCISVNHSSDCLSLLPQPVPFFKKKLLFPFKIPFCLSMSDPAQHMLPLPSHTETNYGERRRKEKREKKAVRERGGERKGREGKRERGGGSVRGPWGELFILHHDTWGQSASLWVTG